MLAAIKEVNKLDYWVRLHDYHLIQAHMNKCGEQLLHVIYIPSQHEDFNVLMSGGVCKLSSFFSSFDPFGASIIILYLMQRCHRLNTREGAQGRHIVPSAAVAVVSKLNTLLALAPLINKTCPCIREGLGPPLCLNHTFPECTVAAVPRLSHRKSTNTVTQELVFAPLALPY